LATRLLRRQDLSYGLYLVHDPISNMVLANGLSGAVAAILTAVTSLAAAAISWFVIERPALARKPARMYAHDSFR
jgi:peptidoglycan/LPS O-acetylase OafA/YrhL